MYTYTYTITHNTTTRQQVKYCHRVTVSCAYTYIRAHLSVCNIFKTVLQYTITVHASRPYHKGSIFYNEAYKTNVS